jgi:hypothetical protein
MKTRTQAVKWALLLSAFLLVIFAETGFAQPPRGRGMLDSTQIAAMVDTMSQKLSLSKEQKEKFGKIYFAAFAEGRKAFEKSQGDFQAIREARRQINEKRDNEVKALLNDEQKKIYDKILQEQQEQMRRRMRERGWRN